MLGLLITVMRLVINWGRLVINRGMVDWFIHRCMMNRGMVNWGMVNNCRGSMNCMMHSRSLMVDSMSTKGCKWNSRTSCHKRDKSN